MMIPLKIFLIRLFTIVGIASIYDGQNWYRVTGFYFRYRYNDGSFRPPVRAWRWLANCIGGAGVCGWYPLIEEVKGLKLSFNRARFFFLKHHLGLLLWSIRNHKHYTSVIFQYQRSFSLWTTKKNLSVEQYETLLLESAVNSALKKLKQRN